MVQKVIWSPSALESFLRVNEYLINTWTQKEVDNFAEKVDNKIAVLKGQPQIGSRRNKKN